MKIFNSVIFLFLSFISFSQDKNNTYILLDDNEELIIHDEYYYYIFANKKDLEEYYYYKENKFPLKDTITGELDLSQMGKPKPYLEISKYQHKAYCINKKEYEKLNVLTRAEFTEKFNEIYNKNNFYFVEKIKDNLYEISPIYIHSQE